MDQLLFEIEAQWKEKRVLLQGKELLQDDVLRFWSEWQETACGKVLNATLTALEEVTLTRVQVTLPFSLLPSDRIFLNGYQSWTDSIEQPAAGITMRGVDKVPRFMLKKYAFDRYGDYHIARYPDAHGFTYCYRRREESYLLAASLSERSGFTVFYPDPARGVLVAEKDCAGLKLEKGACYSAFDLALLCGAEEEVFDAWFRLMRIPAPNARPLWGYTSWYQHYQNISESLCSEILADAPPEWQVFQIDDGWEPAIGDWLAEDTAKFPSGMGTMAEKIKARDMVPGLWLAPFAAQKNSQLCREHPGWIVKDEQGEPLLCGSNWGGFYALDFYLPEVRTYLRQVFERVVHQWGYRLLKLDFLYAVCALPRPDKTRGQIMCEAMDFLRQCAGPAMILACGVPLGPVFGKVEYCRIGTDVSLRYDDVAYMRLFHRERISTKYSLQNTVWRRQLSGRAFLNDPDVFLLREEDQKLTPEQREALALVNALFGDLLFTSDRPSAYAEPQQKLLDRLRLLRSASEIAVEPGDRERLTFCYTLAEQRHRVTITLKNGACREEKIAALSAESL